MGEVKKKFMQGKIIERKKKSCTASSPEKSSCIWKKYSCKGKLKNSPPPHDFSNGPSLIRNSTLSQQISTLIRARRQSEIQPNLSRSVNSLTQRVLSIKVNSDKGSKPNSYSMRSAWVSTLTRAGSQSYSYFKQCK